MKKSNKKYTIYTTSTITYKSIHKITFFSAFTYLTFKNLMQVRPVSVGTLQQTVSPHSPVPETLSQSHSFNFYRSAPASLPGMLYKLQSLPSQSTLSIIRRPVSSVQKFPKLSLLVLLSLTPYPGLQGPS